MPEYLAPGVQVEEVSFRSKSIEGVHTTTTGFIGPTRYGPLAIEPDLLTSLRDFERVYGDGQPLHDGGSPMHNYMWHAVRGFFEEGGTRLYVSRVFRATSSGADGYAAGTLPASGSAATSIQIKARFPGAAGNMRVRFTLRLGQNILSGGHAAGTSTLTAHVNGLTDRDVVWIKKAKASATFSIAESSRGPMATEDTWQFRDDNGGLVQLSGGLTPGLAPDEGDQVRIVTLDVAVEMSGGSSEAWRALPLDPAHHSHGSPDGVTSLFISAPLNLSQARTLPIVVSTGTGITSGLAVLNALFAARPGLHAAVDDLTSDDTARSVVVELGGGDDGQRPGSSEYEGTTDPDTMVRTGLRQLEDIEDISIVAAPGASFDLEGAYHDSAMAIMRLLISHASRMRYRIAVLDSGNNQSVSQVRTLRSALDSTYAALYYPWVRILDPVTNAEIVLPPSGFVAGIYARNDINRGVYKAPANEVVRLALGFELLLNKSQLDILNSEGVNCFRVIEGRGCRLWGARTISSDPEWKYVSVRRYFAYLEHSIDCGTQWAVFEPNGEALWSNVRRTIEDFLSTEWRSGALLGDKPEKAFFVKCDRSTMSQNDLDNGRLVCLIGVAALKPAEFVIFRIGQWTADGKS